jgi:hypothetical protein
MDQQPAWPELPFAAWSETCETLHRWTQVAGKIALALTPLVNHWWNVTLLATARGLSTPPLPWRGSTFTIDFDFLAHRVHVISSRGTAEALPLQAMPVAHFYAELMACLRRLGITVQIWTMPSEIVDAVPFDQDLTNAAYDPVWVERFWQVLSQSDRVLKQFRARFIGKASPVHFFWGSFDLAVTRFSGRPAPPPRGATPNVAAWVMHEAYSHEVSSCGFWPGGGPIPYPAFYSYAYPEPEGFATAPVGPHGAFYSPDLREFILPYDLVRQSDTPDETLLEFLQSTYDAAANLLKWDRKTLERGSP